MSCSIDLCETSIAEIFLLAHIYSVMVWVDMTCSTGSILLPYQNSPVVGVAAVVVRPGPSQGCYQPQKQRRTQQPHFHCKNIKILSLYYVYTLVYGIDRKRSQCALTTVLLYCTAILHCYTVLGVIFFFQLHVFSKSIRNSQNGTTQIIS